MLRIATWHGKRNENRSMNRSSGRILGNFLEPSGGGVHGQRYGRTSREEAIRPRRAGFHKADLGRSIRKEQSPRNFQNSAAIPHNSESMVGDEAGTPSSRRRNGLRGNLGCLERSTPPIFSMSTFGTTRITWNFRRSYLLSAWYQRDTGKYERRFL